MLPSVTQVARQAMATRFEIALHGDDPVRLRAAAEEALQEVERLEGLLSLYRPSSEIARVNARAAREPVIVSPPVFRLLEHAARLSAETGGAFDITVGPLMQCWGFVGGTGSLPDPDALAAARACVGMHLVELDAVQFTVRFQRAGVMLDLGAIGKGYAVGVAADILREAGVTSALIHGGTSTAYAIGCPPGMPHWKVGVARPQQEQAPSDGNALLAMVPLSDAALSVSAIRGKAFQAGTTTYGHVLDPRTGEPVHQADLAAVVLPEATETDALSTALLTLGREGLSLLERLRPGARALVAQAHEDGIRTDQVGMFGSAVVAGS